MVCFQTKNPNLGKFWRVLQWKMLVHFMSIWFILRSLKIFNGSLVYFVVIWYIFPCFGMLYQEKSGNPGGQLNPARRYYGYYVWLVSITSTFRQSAIWKSASEERALR
jgi:hypothetical protein